MVKRHRKLFPINGTECSDFCGDPYVFYYLSPPPPSPPSTPLPLPLPPPGKNDGDQSNGVSPPVIVLFSLLFFFSLLILYYVVVSKSCLGLCKRRRRHEDDLSSSSSSRSDGGGDLENRAAAAAVDHPIWLIATVGLQQAIINSITAVSYRKNEGLIEGTDCTVCLSEFREDETVRLLPKCSHAFHVACIDAWLRSHTNCPLCRASIVAATTTTTASSTEVNGSASRGSLENSTGQNNVLMNGLMEEEEARSVENSAEIESNDTNLGFEENDVVRLVRRSVSMDHVKGSDLRRSYRFDLDFGGQKREGKFLKMVRLSPVAMKKRSLSCGGLRFFSSRQNDNHHLRLNNSILPL